MAIRFDTDAMNAFRALDKSNVNAKIEFQKNTGDVQVNGEYKGPLSALKRTNAEKHNNNNVRAALLESLAKTFGMELSRNEDKKVVFDNAFMDSLEKLLGKDVFKRSDFEINRNGEVSSGKPLTARRISAILSKVDENIKSVKIATYPILSHYENTLNQVAPKLNLDPGGNNLPPALAMAKNCVRLLENVSMGAPLVFFNYVAEGIAVANEEHITASSVDQLKAQLKNVLGCAIDMARFDIHEEDFNLSRADETANHPLEAVADQLNSYLTKQINAFLEAISFALNKIDSNPNIDVNAVLNPQANGGDLTLESYIQHLNAIK